MYKVVYFSSLSGNTHRFVEKLDMPAARIPLSPKDQMIEINEPFVLVVPTYAGDDGSGAVPKQVIHFLNNKNNRSHMCGVIAGGNTNFGKYYGCAGNVISRKCHVPVLCKIELTGTPTDVRKVQEGLRKLWIQQQQKEKMPA